jgi:4-alpha-glucanotransferase
MRAKTTNPDASNRMQRGAGVLMHITSLPSRFAIGDLGPAAYAFADFLQRAGQRYWQMLPLNPTEIGSGHSPYSSTSTFAGNTLLISPEDLAHRGWIRPFNFRKLYKGDPSRADFTLAEEEKQFFLDEAFTTFEGLPARSKKDFEKFCLTERHWLNDFALYVILKRNQNGKPWYQWATPLRDRDRQALSIVAKEHLQEIRKEKWLQYVFHLQIEKLKAYCNQRDIRLFGDLPFYVAYDSADVWANRGIFQLDAKGQMKAVAGVPPDYFNADGQRWGMPVFEWKKLKSTRYDWWIRRIARNLEMFDLLRLDHFRAFEAYWSIPAREKTARNGRWVDGPGAGLFDRLKRQFKDLPLIAEDLGDIDDNVRNLRDRYGMPGMKVLQFGFGDDTFASEYLPHNYSANFVVYTGTHDNNTTKGWFRRDAGSNERSNLKKYYGHDVNASNVNTLLVRSAYSSVARMAIIPMQDLLDEDEHSRMNAPATVTNNWLWRMKPGSIRTALDKWLHNQCLVFNRLEK